MSRSKQILLLAIYKWEIERLSLLTMDLQHKGYDPEKDKVWGAMTCMCKQSRATYWKRGAEQTRWEEWQEWGRQHLQTENGFCLSSIHRIRSLPLLFFLYAIWVSLHGILIIATKRTLTRTTINGNSTIINQWPGKTNTTSNHCPHLFQECTARRNFEACWTFSELQVMVDYFI